MSTPAQGLTDPAGDGPFQNSQAGVQGLRAGAQFWWFWIHDKFALLWTGLMHLQGGLQAGLAAMGGKGHELVRLSKTKMA